MILLFHGWMVSVFYCYIVKNNYNQLQLFLSNYPKNLIFAETITSQKHETFSKHNNG